jgi:hypothetical protein
MQPMDRISQDPIRGQLEGGTRKTTPHMASHSFRYHHIHLPLFASHTHSTVIMFSRAALRLSLVARPTVIHGKPCARSVSVSGCACDSAFWFGWLTLIVSSRRLCSTTKGIMDVFLFFSPHSVFWVSLDRPWVPQPLFRLPCTGWEVSPSRQDSSVRPVRLRHLPPPLPP